MDLCIYAIFLRNWRAIAARTLRLPPPTPPQPRVRFSVCQRSIGSPDKQSRTWPTVARESRAFASLGRPQGGLLRKTARSEEHTSELQSLMRISYAVFCLKKKKTNTT